MGGYTQYPVPNLMALNPHQGMSPYATNLYLGMPYGSSGMSVNPNIFTQSTQNRFAPTKLLFLATLELHDLSKLTNDPVQHHFSWPSIPMKIPTNISKFDGKIGEDPSNHAMTYHIWCSSNSLMDDCIHLHIFQHTLIHSTSKWYVELP